MRLICLCLLLSSQLMAQHFFTNTGVVRFFSEAPIENIEAVNESVSAIIDSKSGGFAFRLKIEDFIFPNSLMQEHFNESYLESERYPLSTFTGTIANYSTLDLSKAQKIAVKGELNIHGISQQTDILASLQRIDSVMYISSTFDVALDDYEIDIPKIMLYKIAEVIRVTVDIKLQIKSDE